MYQTSTVSKSSSQRIKIQPRDKLESGYEAVLYLPQSNNIAMHSPYDITQSMNTRQQTDTVSAALQSFNAKERDTAILDPRNTTPLADTNIVPRTPPVTLKDLVLNYMNDGYEVSYGSTFDLDAAPDSPCTLLGDEVNLDEICSPLSLDSSSGYFIAETPPRSPSTLFGDGNDLDDLHKPAPSGICSGNLPTQDQPRSPSTILGDRIDTDRAQVYPAMPSSSDVFTHHFNDQDDPQSPSTVIGTEFDREAVNNVSSNLDLPSPYNYPEESEGNDIINNFLHDPPNQPARAYRSYVQWPGLICDAVPLVDEWPGFVIEAFIEEDWRFGLDEKGRTVLELISGRRDLEMWFTDMSNKMQFS